MEEQQKHTPESAALAMVDQAINVAFTKGVFDRNDSKVINAAMDVLAKLVEDARPKAGKEVQLKAVNRKEASDESK